MEIAFQFFGISTYFRRHCFGYRCLDVFRAWDKSVFYFCPTLFLSTDHGESLLLRLLAAPQKVYYRTFGKMDNSRQPKSIN